MRLRFFSIFSLLLAANTFAASPLWTVQAITPTTVSLPQNSTVMVKYRVTNQSTKSHTLVMTPMTGVTQITTNGNCENPFTLAGGGACILTFIINGSQVSGDITSGPRLCEQGSELLCYQPTRADSLNETLTASSSVATLQVQRTPVNVFNGGLNQTVTIKNTSLDLTATNLILSFVGTNLEPYIVEVSNNCTSVAPQSTCQIVLSDPLHATTTSPTTVSATLQSADGNSEVVSVTTTEYSVGDNFGTNGSIGALHATDPLLNLVVRQTRDIRKLYSLYQAPISWNEATSDKDGRSNTDIMLTTTRPFLAEAAYLCRTYSENVVDNSMSYSYYLPAKLQIGAITNNQSVLGNIEENTDYWSSTVIIGVPTNTAWIAQNDDGVVIYNYNVMYRDIDTRCVHDFSTP